MPLCLRLSDPDVEVGKTARGREDCLAGLSRLPDGSADFVIIDPPYEAEAHTSHRLVARAGGKLEVELLTFPPITEEQRTESARQMARLARRRILVFCQVTCRHRAFDRATIVQAP